MCTVKAIELKNVSFGYDGFPTQVLKHVNFSVAYGEVALLSGLSGEGKSTLLSIVSGIIPNIIAGEITGEVLVDGKSTRGQKLSQVCRKVGVVLQNADSQIIHRTAEDEIAFGCENFAIPADRIGEQIDRVCALMGLDKTAQTRTLSGGQIFMPTVEQEVAFHAQSRAYADEMMRLFGLEHLRGRHPQSLSEGQKRRVSIAAVAAGNPKVLLLDEPTVGQDYQGLCELVKVLDELHDRSGNTMIAITHDMRCAEALCDRAVLIADGKVQEQGGKELVRRYFRPELPVCT